MKENEYLVLSPEEAYKENQQLLNNWTVTLLQVQDLQTQIANLKQEKSDLITIVSELEKDKDYWYDEYLALLYR